MGKIWSGIIGTRHEVFHPTCRWKNPWTPWRKHCSISKTNMLNLSYLELWTTSIFFYNICRIWLSLKAQMEILLMWPLKLSIRLLKEVRPSFVLLLFYMDLQIWFDFFLPTAASESSKFDTYFVIHFCCHVIIINSNSKFFLFCWRGIEWVTFLKLFFVFWCKQSEHHYWNSPNLMYRAFPDKNDCLIGFGVFGNFLTIFYG